MNGETWTGRGEIAGSLVDTVTDYWDDDRVGWDRFGTGAQ